MKVFTFVFDLVNFLPPPAVCSEPKQPAGREIPVTTQLLSFSLHTFGFEHHVNGRSAQQKRGTVQIQKNSFSHTDEQGGEGGCEFFSSSF
jgi:hypothetical protein